MDPEATSTDDPTTKHSGLYLGGDDMLIGGEGNDNIAGGPGNDVIVGDRNYQRLDTKDVLCGGPGRDLFRTDFPDLVFYELDGEPNINNHIYDFSNVEPGLSECAWDSSCPSLLP